MPVSYIQNAPDFNALLVVVFTILRNTESRRRVLFCVREVQGLNLLLLIGCPDGFSFVVFSPSMHIVVQCLKLGHDPFLRYLFRSIAGFGVLSCAGHVILFR